MMGSDVDYYDVERMVEDATRPLRAALAELREEIGRERVARQDAVEEVRGSIDSLGRVLASRTEHLA